MGINWKRVLLGGLLAGLIINAVEFLVNGVLLQRDWADAMKALGKPETFSGGQVVVFNAVGFAIGIFAIWLYAGIRPRYGAGPKTALLAAVAVWLVGYAIPMLPPAMMEMFPLRLLTIGLAAGLVEILLAAMAGARIYREAGGARAGTATA